MSIYSDIKEIYKDLKNDKIMNWLFRIVLAAVAIMAIVATGKFAVDLWKGNHTKVLYGAFEFNEEKKIVHDTVRVVIKDTIRVPKYIDRTKSNNNYIDKVDVLNQ